ncbi:MAG: TonB-dependent receptor [Chlorobi bacterium]|nr:TonB-dependent receptor [Chlorobiota bacterium]
MKRIIFQIKQSISFKKWKLKGYAVFNSLGREVKILVLAASYSTILGVHQLFALTESDSVARFVRLSEVEVTAGRTPSVTSETGRFITVISKKDISEFPVQSVDGLLRYIAGVDIRQRGPLGIQSDISIRGGSFNQVMVLLNGINISDPQTGHFNMNLPVGIESIERIEILQGPGARAYGPGALCGAVNIITSDKKQKETSAELAAGGYGFFNAGVSTSMPSEKFRNYVSADFSRSDGYTDNTDFNNLHLFYNGSVSVGKPEIDFQVGYSNKAFGANSFYTPKYPEQFEQVKTTFASVKSLIGQRMKIRPALYWRRNQDRFELFRNEPPEWYSGHNYHLTDVAGGNLNVTVLWKAGRTSFGGEIRHEKILSNNIGYPLAEPVPVPGEACAVYDKSYSRTNNSFFLEHLINSGRLNMSAGILFNYNSSPGSNMKIYPGLDISFYMTSGLKLFGSINSGMRMPSFTEMFYSGPVNTGNPALKPEEATTCEVGVNNLLNFMENKFSVFYRKSRNLIDWGRMEGDEKYMTRNLSDMNTVGLEISSTIDVSVLSGNDEVFLRNLTLGYSYINQDKNSIPGYESVYVMDYLKNKLNISAAMKIVSKLMSELTMEYNDRNGNYTAYKYIDGDYIPVQVPYSPFVLVNAKVQWIEKSWLLYVDAKNIFDKKYYDIGNVVQPGIWVTAGVKIKFDY